jgi:hypothetical protein
LVNEPDGIVKRVIRRRVSRRHRRHRLIQRVLLLLVVAIFAVTFSLAALRHVSPSLFAKFKAPGREQVEASRTKLLMVNDETFRPAPDRPVYPYSVIAGGVEDARELKWVAEHDPVVAAHYAGFDYDHARVVKLTLARTVYLSYRIGNKVYWTSHRVTLHKGEKVITDGRMTARTRCANRVEEVPQQATSTSEPPATKFEEPVKPKGGTAIQEPPVPFQSALLNRPNLPGVGPDGPLSLFNPFGPGNWVPIAPPPIPTGLCGPPKPKKGEVQVVSEADGKKKKPTGPCGTSGGGGESVPEPGTWLLVASGVAATYWQARRKFARAA